MKEFIEAYYGNIHNKPACKEIEEVKTITTIEQITEVKKIKNPKYDKKNAEMAQMEGLSKIMAMASKFGVSADKLGISIPSQEIVISNSNGPAPTPQTIEKEYIEVTEVNNVEVIKEIKTVRLERYYDSLYFKFSSSPENAIKDIKMFMKNLYNTFSFKYQTDNIRSFEKYFSASERERSERERERENCLMK